MKLALITTDVREHTKDYANPVATFGAAPEALLQGFAQVPELEVHVLSCARQPMRSQEKLAPNIWFHSLYVPRWGWLRTLYQGCIRAVRRKLKEVRPDIVHGQGTELDCALDAVWSGFPNVVTLHGIMIEMARQLHAPIGSFHWCAARLEQWTLKHTAGVFCNSAFTETQVHPRARRTWRVPNAVRSEFFSRPKVTAKNARFVMVHVGVVCSYKQQLAVLEMAGRLHGEGWPLEVHFLGAADPRDPYAQKFLAQIQSAERDGYGRYLGTRPLNGLIECLDGAAALVHTPTVETFGLVVAEALARGLKLFGFRVGGVPDVVEGAAETCLVEGGDWQSLENGIRTWLRAGRRAEPSAAATMWERYQPLAVARRHLEIYREVLGGPR